MSKILQFPGNGDGKKSVWWLAHVNLFGEPEPRLAYIPVEKLEQGVREVAEVVRTSGKHCTALWLELVEVPGEVPRVG